MKVKNIFSKFIIGGVIAVPITSVSCYAHDVSLDKDNIFNLVNDSGDFDDEVFLESLSTSDKFYDVVEELFKENMWYVSNDNAGDYTSFSIKSTLLFTFLDGEIKGDILIESNSIGNINDLSIDVINSSYSEKITTSIISSLDFVSNNIKQSYIDVSKNLKTINEGIKGSTSLSQSAKNRDSIEYIYNTFDNKEINYIGADGSFTWVAGSASSLSELSSSLNLMNATEVIFNDFYIGENISWNTTMFTWNDFQSNNTNNLFLHFIVGNEEIIVSIELSPISQEMSKAYTYFDEMVISSTLTSEELIHSNVSDENTTYSELLELETKLGLVGDPLTGNTGVLTWLDDNDLRFVNVEYTYRDSQLAHHRMLIHVADEIHTRSFFIVLNDAPGVINV